MHEIKFIGFLFLRNDLHGLSLPIANPICYPSSLKMNMGAEAFAAFFFFIIANEFYRRATFHKLSLHEGERNNKQENKIDTLEN